MKRTKLQAMVQSALSPQHQISTEGFLGDVVSKITDLFSSRKKLLEKGDYDKNGPSTKVLKDRLKETVLDAKWMEKATLKTQPISAQWALPGLDYKQQLKGDVVEHLKKSVPEYQTAAMAFFKLQVAYSEASNKLFDDYLKEIASAYKAGKDLTSVMAEFDKKSTAIKAPTASLKSKPLDLFNNRQLVSEKPPTYVNFTQPAKSSVTSIPPLTKEGVVEVAKLLLSVLESPITTMEGLRFEVDWDDITDRLVDLGLGSSDADDIYDDVTEPEFVNRFYHQHAWDECGHWELERSQADLIKSLLHLLDASIK